MHLDVSLLAVLAGHLIGNFPFRTEVLKALFTSISFLSNNTPACIKHKSPLIWILVKALCVSAITWLLLGTWSAWFMAIGVFILNLLIECVKCRISPKVFLQNQQINNCINPDHCGTVGFLSGQITQLVALVLLWMSIYHGAESTNSPAYYLRFVNVIQYSKLLILISGSVIGIWGVGELLKHQLLPLANGLENKDGDCGIPKGGRIIGILERTFVLIFVIAGQPEAAGFVLATKSVFRIGDLKETQDRTFAEYIMIGTFCSFAYSFIIAYGTKWLIDHIQ